MSESTPPDVSLPAPVQATDLRFRSKWATAWHNLLRQFGPGTAPSSIGTSPNRNKSQEPAHTSPGSVVEDRIIVDRLWTGEVDIATETSIVEDETAPDPSGASPPRKQLWQEPDPATLNTGWLNRIWFFLRWQLLPASSGFFYPRGYSGEEAELSYRKVCTRHYSLLHTSILYQEDWFVTKPLARWAAGWLICNWVLGIGFLVKPFQLIDFIFYCGLAPGLSFPILSAVIVSPCHLSANSLSESWFCTTGPETILSFTSSL